MRKLAAAAVAVALLALVLSVVRLDSDDQAFSFWPAGADGDSYELTCEDGQFDPELCRLVARQLVADQHVAHPHRLFYWVEVRREGITLCWDDHTVSASADSRERRACLHLDEHGAPTPGPGASLTALSPVD